MRLQLEIFKVGKNFCKKIVNFLKFGGRLLLEMRLQLEILRYLLLFAIICITMVSEKKVGIGTSLSLTIRTSLLHVIFGIKLNR